MATGCEQGRRRQQGWPGGSLCLAPSPLLSRVLARRLLAPSYLRESLFVNRWLRISCDLALPAAGGTHPKRALRRLHIHEAACCDKLRSAAGRGKARRLAEQHARAAALREQPSVAARGQAAHAPSWLSGQAEQRLRSRSLASLVGRHVLYVGCALRLLRTPYSGRRGFSGARARVGFTAPGACRVRRSQGCGGTRAPA